MVIPALQVGRPEEWNRPAQRMLDSGRIPAPPGLAAQLGALFYAKRFNGLIDYLKQRLVPGTVPGIQEMEGLFRHQLPQGAFPLIQHFEAEAAVGGEVICNVW